MPGTETSKSIVMPPSRTVFCCNTVPLKFNNSNCKGKLYTEGTPIFQNLLL